MNDSKHAAVRRKQRGIPEALTDLILEYGTATKRPGRARRLVVRKRDVARLRRQLKHLQEQVERLSNRGLVVSDDGTVITVYHLTR